MTSNYQALRDTLDLAFQRASEGKGRERHGVHGRDFTEQPVILISEMLNSIDGPLYQIIKKAQEASTMIKTGDPTAAANELLDIAVYAAAAHIMLAKSGALKRVPSDYRPKETPPLPRR